MKVSESEFRFAVKKNKSKRGVLLSLGYSPTGSNYIAFNKLMVKWEIDCSHFLGQASNKGRKFPKKKEWVELLVKGSDYNICRAKNRLVDDGFLKNFCYVCNIAPSWLGKPLVLVLDHINGDKRDNRIENLRLLCPNCNSQTPTFAGRNVSGKFCQLCNRRMSKIYYADETICRSCIRNRLRQNEDFCRCGNKKSTRAKKCVGCEYTSRKGQERISVRKFNPTKQELQNLVWEMPMTQLGSMFGVSDKAVAKRCKKMGINLPLMGYWLKNK